MIVDQKRSPTSSAVSDLQFAYYSVTMMGDLLFSAIRSRDAAELRSLADDCGTVAAQLRRAADEIERSKA